MDLQLLANTGEKIQPKRFGAVVGPKSLFYEWSKESLMFAKVPYHVREGLERME